MLVPKLRFKREDGTDYPEWEKKKIGDLLSLCHGKDYKHLGKGDIPVMGTGGIITYVDEALCDWECVCIGRKGTIDRPYYMDKPFWSVDTLFYSKPKKGNLPKFQYYLFQNINWHYYNEASGVPSLSASTIEKIRVIVPCLEEEQKIANFLSNIDEVIAQSRAEIQNLEQQKKAAMQKIFSQEVRFKREDGTDYPAWEEKVFTDLFKSIPNKDYQVQTKEYKPNGKYRIIDQSQSFIAGYSDLESKVCYQNPCIIFGDHTTILKYVDFPFIVGADGVKTLITNDCYVAKYCFYLLGFNNVKPTGYNRHYSKLKELTLLCSTDIEEQRKIADFLSAYDEAISYAKQELDKWKELKKGLLQQMFV